MSDPDPADVAADDALVENLSQGGPPLTTDPTEWYLAGKRDQHQDEQCGT